MTSPSGHAGALPIDIRIATIADVDAITTLISAYVADGTLLPRTPEFVRERVGDFLVAVDHGAVLGCVHLEEYSPSLVEVRSLAVDARHQGRGIGQAMVARAERLAAARDYRTVFAVSNSERFFTALGYEERHIPELDRERSEVSRYKGVHAKDL